MTEPTSAQDCHTGAGSLVVYTLGQPLFTFRLIPPMSVRILVSILVRLMSRNTLFLFVLLGSWVVAPAPAPAQPARTGAFAMVQPMKQFRRQQTATLLLDGRVLVAGGAPFLQAATSEIFDPTTGNWTNSGRLAFGREFHTATLLQDGRVVVTGGQTATQLLSATEVYDPPSGRWIAAGVLNEARE